MPMLYAIASAICVARFMNIGHSSRLSSFGKFIRLFKESGGLVVSKRPSGPLVWTQVAVAEGSVLAEAQVVLVGESVVDDSMVVVVEAFV